MQRFIDVHSHLPASSSDVLRVHNFIDRYEHLKNGRWYSIGIHPWHINNVTEQMATLRANVAQPAVIAIGECGLDRNIAMPLTQQLEAFAAQIQLANEVGKPLIIHCVRAFDEVLTALKMATVPVIFHGFNKKQSVAEKVLAHGYYLSFGQAIMNTAAPSAAVLKSIPANRYFLETDDADIPIENLYQQAAAIRNTDVETIILQVQQNFTQIFGSI